MSKRVGVAIYPEIVGIKATFDYLTLASEYGVKRAFANLLEISNDEKGRAELEELKKVFHFAKKLDIELIIDVNPKFYKSFNLQPNEIDFFHNLGVAGIRLDEDFGGTIEAELSNNKFGFKIELNASSTNETFLKAITYKANVENLVACHNFYPMRYTGLDLKRFIELCSFYKAKNIRVAAFITLPQHQKGVGPWNVNEGMPSIEEHRDLSLEEQLWDFLSLDLVDDIIVSQQGVTRKQFETLNKVLSEYNEIKKKPIVDLHIEFIEDANPVEIDIALVNKEKLHTNRPDFNSYTVRSTFPRIDYESELIKPHHAGRLLKRGDVVVLNENLGRYKGEIHILKKEIDDSKQHARNYIGKVITEDLHKLELIKNKIKFKLLSCP